MKSKKIAILGATSHIAKGLICNFIQEGKNKLFLFARTPKRAKDFIKSNRLKGDVNIFGFNDFAHKEYDFIINCVGMGTPNKVKDNQILVFNITEEYDNLILDYLSKFSQSSCINFSSGAVYGSSFNEAVGDSTVRKIKANNISREEYYGLAKMNSEAKHRAQNDLNIVDVRIFAYFSRFIDLDSGYILTQLIDSIKRKKEFVTNSCDFVRDYLNPIDLFKLVKLITNSKPMNAAIDAYSLAPVTKFEILKFFSKAYGLKYKIKDNIDFLCPTGKKSVYYSNSRKAARLGYKPQYSSIRTIEEESKIIIGQNHE